jgi:hypothetical protein
MTVHMFHQGTDVVLQVPCDNINPIKKGLKARIDHMQESYGLCMIIYKISTNIISALK